MVKRLLNSVGKSTFVEYYDVVKNAEDINEIIEAYKENKEDWNDSSMKTKAYSSLAIFENNYQREALLLVISSTRISDETIRKAKEIYERESTSKEIEFVDKSIISKNTLNKDNWQELKRLLMTVGKSTFVKYYDVVKKAQDINEIIEAYRRKSESWNDSSMNSKANSSLMIFDKQYSKDALLLIIYSNRAGQKTVNKAREIYKREFPDEELEIIRFIRPEFVFGEDIVNNLFSDYTIIEQYRVDDYIVDWYIPELNLVIEYDERHHQRNVEEDAKRQKNIESKLKCKFIRYTEN